MPIQGMSQAHAAVAKAIKLGLLQPINAFTKCADCGKPAKHYDHRDYNKPLEVEAVCQKCNRNRGSAKPNLNFKHPISSMERKLVKFTENQVFSIYSLSKKTGLSVSEHIRRAVDEYLEKKK